MFNLLTLLIAPLVHSNRVVHGDLSGVRRDQLFRYDTLIMFQSNVLVMENGTACLSDFGLSGVVSEFFGSSTFSSTISGNVRWGAPELFAPPENQDGPTNRPTKGADIYSFGSTMLQVRTVLWIAIH